ncbi:MAG: hypothetical protein NWS74_06830 [Salibacteraceae bacterium]|nr:hypothetical protein [Salibacteraceae bacterium]MDP4763251.1 hypothetical protein [Salibacteraceae bacterium]MDP4843595.1 hypothetical protein [Salibacteraceae bacterium]
MEHTELLANNAKMIVIAYLIYLPIALFLTYYVARTLFKNGKVFMLDIFKGREEIASATNRLFEMGFYLLNLGFALMILKINFNNDYLFDKQMLIEALSTKVGGFSIYLGVMLFLNLYLFFRGKRKSKENLVKPDYQSYIHPQQG